MIRNQLARLAVAAAAMIVLSAAAVTSGQLDPPRFGRLDPAKYRITPSHNGAGVQFFEELIGNAAFGKDMKIFETPVLFFHRCRIPPRSGIGEHLHRNMEEMYWGFNIPSEYTVDGRTALLPAGTSVVCQHNHSHGIFNTSLTDTLEFLNIAVQVWQGNPRGADYNDSLTTKTVESPAPFRWTALDRSLLTPEKNWRGGAGTVRVRRFYGPDMFTTPWEAMDHVVIPPKASIGYHRPVDVEEIFYILSGTGRFTLNSRSFDIRPDDAVPVTIGDAGGLFNTGTTNLELFIMTVAKVKGTVTIETLGDDLTRR